jgi:hypothetical protein
VPTRCSRRLSAGAAALGSDLEAAAKKVVSDLDLTGVFT